VPRQHSVQPPHAGQPQLACQHRAGSSTTTGYDNIDETGALAATLLFRWLAPDLTRHAKNVIIAHAAGTSSVAAESTLR
jgi:hypothetical protein